MITMVETRLRVVIYLAVALLQMRPRASSLMPRIRGVVAGNVPSFRTGGILLMGAGAMFAVSAAMWGLGHQTRQAQPDRTLAEFQARKLPAVTPGHAKPDVAGGYDCHQPQADSRVCLIDAIVARQLAYAAMDRASRRDILAAMEKAHD